MYQLTFTTYLLILLALTAHYPIGKRLGIKHFFSSTLTGLAVSAAIVAALANVYASLIRPYIFITILIGCGLLVYDIIHERIYHNWLVNIDIKKYAVLVVVGISFLLLNNPKTIFLSTEGDETYLHFNRHYSYYASQSIEMLNASYDSRLKVPNFYPYEWNRYHFFNSATQAITQGLIQQPTLITFLITQMIIIVFMLLAFAENFISLYGWSKKNLLLLAAWFALGFTLFSFSIKWSLVTTSPFSVFAAVLIVISILSKKYRAAVLFLFILGLSAFRMMPIALCLIAFFCLVYLFKAKFNIKTIFYYIKKIKVIEYLSIAAFIIYNYLTYFSGTAANAQGFDTNIFAEGWLYMLVTFKFFGYITQLIGASKLLLFNQYGFFDKLLAAQWLQSLLLGVFIIGGFYVLSEMIYIGKKKPSFLWSSGLIITLITLVYHYFSPAHTDIKLYIITIPYLVLMVIFGFRLAEQSRFVDWLLFYGFIGISFASSIILQYTGVDPAIRVPPMYIMFDIVLWVIIGAYMLKMADNKKYLITNIIFSVAMLLLFKCDIIGMTKISDQDNNYIKAPVTEFVQSNFQRSNYVDENNILTMSPADPNLVDVYSSVLGANVNYTPGHEMFMNHRFTDFTTQ